MRAFILALLLAVAVATAAPIDDAEYVSVVAEADGAVGVIAAANLAAAMQVHGYTFTGAIDTEAAGIEGLDEKFLIFLDGKEAVIVDNLGRPGAAAKAREWLGEQGYGVELGSLEEVLPGYGAVEPAAIEAAPPPCDGCRYGATCLAAGTRTASQYCDAGGEMRGQKAVGDACAAGYECFTERCEAGLCAAAASEEAPGSAVVGSEALPESEPVEGSAEGTGRRSIFSAIISWFAGWFS